ncbi:MAG TPA: penicillin-binding transpeptidase domain-containing protein [Acidimicrobiales bacterium]|nr:penicillin-binding transpeptidase domain-containing protein [Acidimicrobiales bacterium]
MQKQRHGGNAADSLVGMVVGAGGLALTLLLAPLTLTAAAPAGPPAPSPAVAVAAVAEGYLRAWEHSDLEAMSLLLSANMPEFDETHGMITEKLSVVSARFRSGDPEVLGEVAVVPFAADLELAGLGTWEYEGRLHLVLGVPEPRALPTVPVADEIGESPSAAAPGDPLLDAVGAEEPRWSVAWSPAAIHPGLGAGQTLLSLRRPPERAPLVGVDGTPLTGEDAADVPALSSQVLGRVATLDEVGAAALGGLYLPGDQAGVSGLEAAYESRLGGRPSGEVRVVDDRGELVDVLHRFPGQDGVPVQTTFDADVQAAAEAALTRVSNPSALVAIDGPTGQVRAVANRPTSGFNRALVGRYPPGSTFKVVTATALLDAGVTPATEVSCPAKASVDGYRFSNAGGEVLGEIPFAMAFYRSCNTAFVQLVDELEPDLLVAAAEGYGFNTTFDLPLPAETGSFPEPRRPIERASAAIGQGQVTATPLHMATVAAAVTSGTWHEPTVTLSGDATPGSASGGRPLPAGVASTLRELMVRVVEEGTGTAAQVPGEAVGGKTGTAEFGTADPPRTHAWFIGFRGDMAVAVLVEDAGFGGSVAAPIARSFFSALE